MVDNQQDWFSLTVLPAVTVMNAMVSSSIHLGLILRLLLRTTTRLVVGSLPKCAIHRGLELGR
jgi:hypothetical protein